MDLTAVDYIIQLAHIVSLLNLTSNFLYSLSLIELKSYLQLLYDESHPDNPEI